MDAGQDTANHPGEDSGACLSTRLWRPASPVLPVAFLTALGTAGMFLGQPNTLAHLPILVLFYPFCLYILSLGAASDKSAFLRCYILGLAANSCSLYWIIHPMHDVAGLPYAAAVPCVILLSVYLACFAALTGLGMRRLRRLFCSRSAGSRPTLLALLLAPLLSGAVYGGFEVLGGTLFTGFPWLSLSSAFAFWPEWVQAASLTGSYGLSAVFAAAACALAAALVACAIKERLAALLLGLLLCAAPPVFGLSRLETALPAQSEKALSLLMIQGNVDQNQKWDPAFQSGTLERYIELSNEALKNIRDTQGEHALPHVVLWPETAMPFYFQLHREYEAKLRGFARQNKVNLIFGTLGIGESGEELSALYNRVYLLSSTGDTLGWYDKQHLVPFGEYIPLAANVAFLQKLLQGVDFASGKPGHVLRMALPERERDPLSDAPLPPLLNGKPQVVGPGLSRPASSLSLGTLICYEAIFPYLAQQQVAAGASLIVNVSNDAWFRLSSAPWQHLSLTAMRAVEQARPIVRCTNTGISAIIDARGRITDKGEKMFTPDTLAATVMPSDELTPYHKIHPLPEWIMGLFALFSLTAHKLRKA